MQIFSGREYECLDDFSQPGLIIDCGANVGYSSAYFLSKHPNAYVVAVEPDPDNFTVLKRNLAPYGDRVNVVRAGIWSHTAALAMAQEVYRDGRAWTRQVRVCDPREKGGFAGIDIGSLLASTGYMRISILKVDIEGAEAVVFANNYETWINLVDAIAIELHDDSTFGRGSEVFLSAISGRGFEISHSGELTICRRAPQKGLAEPERAEFS